MKEIKKDKNLYFMCEECGFIYKQKIWALQCEEWCKKNKSCNTDIIKHAVKGRFIVRRQ